MFLVHKGTSLISYLKLLFWNREQGESTDPNPPLLFFSLVIVLHPTPFSEVSSAESGKGPRALLKREWLSHVCVWPAVVLSTLIGCNPILESEWHCWDETYKFAELSPHFLDLVTDDQIRFQFWVPDFQSGVFLSFCFRLRTIPIPPFPCKSKSHI